MPNAADGNQVRELVATGAHLVEVLPEEEFSWAHLPDALNVPLKQLDSRIDELDRRRDVVVYFNDTL